MIFTTSFSTFLVTMALLGCARPAPMRHATRFDTPAWSQPGKLSLRAESKNERTLLLKHKPTPSSSAASPPSARAHGDEGGESVYRYRPDRGALENLPNGTWERATGEICDCHAQQILSSDPLLVNTKTHTLHSNEHVIRTAGQTVLRLAVAPERTKIAVLSAEGPRAGSVAPWLGQGGAAGRHYHQVFTLPDAKPVGDPVVLPLSWSRVNLGACWSADARWIVYYDVLFREVFIIDTKASAHVNQNGEAR